MKIISNIPEVADRWARRVEDDVRKAVQRAALRTARVGELRIQGIIEREAFDRGTFRQSISAVVRVLDAEVVLTISSALEYAFYIEHGRKPGKWPNLDALTGWVGRMLRKEGINTRANITFDQLQQLARQKTQGGKASAQAKAARKHLAAVYLIGRKIATKGIKQKLIFKRVEDGLLRFLRQELEKELNFIV